MRRCLPGRADLARCVRKPKPRLPDASKTTGTSGPDPQQPPTGPSQRGHRKVTVATVVIQASAPQPSPTLLILALERHRRSKLLSPDEADLRLLLALETFPPGPDGLRSVGMEELARAAGVPYATARRSRDRLVADGLIECQSGSGRGVCTRWLFTSPLKVLSQGEQVSGRERCSPKPRGAKASKAPRRRRADPPSCRVCHCPLDPDPVMAAYGVHPNCAPDDAPDPFAPRRPVSPETTAARGAAKARAALEGKQP